MAEAKRRGKKKKKKKEEMRGKNNCHPSYEIIYQKMSQSCDLQPNKR